MCGIAGFWNSSHQLREDESGFILGKMNDSILHRGPDSEGKWSDANQGIFLGFRRLAILDLSAEGNQPMVSACSRYVITYNGEIYNFLELKKEIIASEKFPFAFRGHSDTEVVLAAFTVFGIEKTLSKLNGMFAMCVWDRDQNRMVLARDRLGKKPLYYGWCRGMVIFASELKAFRENPAFDAKIDRNALALFFRHNYIPTPFSIYEGIYKLPPATFLTINKNKTDNKPVPYWTAKGAIEAAKQKPFQGDIEAAKTALTALLRDAVQIRTLSDVPLGAFLSGGIDSSTIVALMQAQSSKPVKTFTIGFSETQFDEARYAKEIAHHLGTDHTEVFLTPKESLSVIPKLATYYDEPFSDSSQIPTYLISKVARQHVTVCLSGDGGDEIFCGYNRYSWGRRINRIARRVPQRVKNGIASVIKGIPSQTWTNVADNLQRLTPSNLRVQNAGDKLHKLAEVFGSRSSQKGSDNFYLDLVSHWKHPTDLVLDSNEPLTLLTDPRQINPLDDDTEKMMYWDLLTYLPDDILAKVDRASMANSLEVRAPFLDYRIVEFAWQLPLEFKLFNGQGKHLIREILYQYVPKKLLDRPKMGFGVPLAEWLRGPLKDWASDLLDPSRLKSEQFLNPEPIQKLWQEHVSGSRNWHSYLWDVLIFQSWLETTYHISKTEPQNFCTPMLENPASSNKA